MTITVTPCRILEDPQIYDFEEEDSDEEDRTLYRASEIKKKIYLFAHLAQGLEMIGASLMILMNRLTISAGRLLLQFGHSTARTFLDEALARNERRRTPPNGGLREETAMTLVGRPSRFRLGPAPRPQHEQPELVRWPAEAKP